MINVENRSYNAMIFLVEYDEGNALSYKTLRRIPENNGKMEFTVIVIIEPQNKVNEKLCVCALKVNDENEEVQGAILKEIVLFESEDVELNEDELIEQRELPRPDICNYIGRETYKLDFSEFRLFGKGNYVLTLLGCSIEELKSNPSNVLENKQISSVCFVVE